MDIVNRVVAQFKAANTYKPYLVSDKGKTHILVGPFPDKDAARRAWWFSQPREITDDLWKRHGLDWLKYGLSGKLLEISDLEVENMVGDPGSWGYSKVEVKPPKVKVHPSWKDGWGGMTSLDDMWRYFTSGKLPF